MVELLKLGSLNKNKRIYNKDSFKEFPTEVKVTLGESYFEDKELIPTIGVANNFKIVDNYLLSNIVLCDKDIFKDLRKSSIEAVPAGYANIESIEDGFLIKDYVIDRVSIILSSTSSNKYSIVDKIKLYFIKRKLNGK